MEIIKPPHSYLFHVLERKRRKGKDFKAGYIISKKKGKKKNSNFEEFISSFGKKMKKRKRYTTADSCIVLLEKKKKTKSKYTSLAHVLERKGRKGKGLKFI